MANYRVLFCASEVYPLIKTGGLADVAGSLPQSLNKAGHEIRVVLPAYQSVLEQLKQPAKTCVETRVYDYAVSVKQTSLPGTRVPVWLIDCPQLFNRPGNPYLDETGEPWPDNAIRFGVFNRIICSLALNQFGMQWQPDVVHCNDWQTGLVPALLQNENKRPATVFTVHNLAYQGVFDRAAFEQLQLPEHFWHYEQLEYHGQFSFIKGGLTFADRINTVSPNYAREIQTPQFGCGLQDLLQLRSDRLSGIINGIDTKTWNPGTDNHLPQKFNHQQLEGKHVNRLALQKTFAIPQRDDLILIGMVSRLTEQKGFDILISILPEMSKRKLQLVILGSGTREYEKAFLKAASRWPEQLAVHIGYDETLAHLIEAGADAFLMPSRFEPCGLNQMYSQRYGTLPVVTPVGGLYDTVIDATKENLEQKTATGFVLNELSDVALLDTLDRVIECYNEKERWRGIMKTAMKQDFSWLKSAAAYTQLYQQAARDNPKPV